MQGKSIGKIQSALVRIYEVKILSIVLCCETNTDKASTTWDKPNIEKKCNIFRVCLHTPKKKLLQWEERGGNTCVLHKWCRVVRLMRAEV